MSIKPMEGNWAMSLERKNVFKGYTKDNVCLVCVEFNTADYAVLQSNVKSGSSGFSREKFLMFLGYLWLKKGVIKSEDELEDIFEMQKHTVSRARHSDITTKSGITLYRILAKQRYYGQILLVTSPSGLNYIFKSDCTDKSRHNIFSGIKKTGIAIMTQELEKYPEEEFTITPLLSCKRDKLEFYRQHFAKIYENNIRKRPTTSDNIRKQIANSLIEINIENRKGHDGRSLPKYVKYNEWKDRQGYMIVNHPNCKKKSFTNKKYSNDQLYNICIEFLKELDMQK